MATRSHVPYFFNRPVLSPAVDLGPPSESDFLLLAEERADDLRESLGAEPNRSLRLNLPPSLECTDEDLLLRGAGLDSTGVAGAWGSFFNPLAGVGSGGDIRDDKSGLIPDMLAALLGA